MTTSSPNDPEPNAAAPTVLSQDSKLAARLDVARARLGRGPSATTDLSAAIILVEPQLGDNIGSAARAMLNFGLDDLRLVNPRDGWPNPRAYQFASGAVQPLDQARVTWNLDEAISDLTLVAAATARPRDLEKPMWTPDEMAEIFAEEVARGGRVGVMFGREKTGLETVDIAKADAIVSVPVNPQFPSLNVSTCVGVIAYALRTQGTRPICARPMSEPAERASFEGLITHLQEELEQGGFFYPPEKTALLKANIRTGLQRARLTEQEVRTLRGAIVALAVGRGVRWRKGREPEPGER